MTRVNVIPVYELSDQHLIAEYRELPRVIKQNINICNAPDCYTLGTGHMKWAARHWKYTINRFDELCQEMQYRGFAANYASSGLGKYAFKFNGIAGNYNVSDKDIALNRARIKEKYNQKPDFYRWTRRSCPKWLKNKSD